VSIIKVALACIEALGAQCLARGFGLMFPLVIASARGQKKNLDGTALDFQAVLRSEEKGGPEVRGCKILDMIPGSLQTNN
jgi:hypothetical protein